MRLLACLSICTIVPVYLLCSVLVSARFSSAVNHSTSPLPSTAVLCNPSLNLSMCNRLSGCSFLSTSIVLICPWNESESPQTLYVNVPFSCKVYAACKHCCNLASFSTIKTVNGRPRLVTKVYRFQIPLHDVREHSHSYPMGFISMDCFLLFNI